MIRTIAKYIALATLSAGAGWAISPGCGSFTPPLIVGTPVNVTCSPTGGESPFTFSISAGALPPGLTQDPGSGTISGNLMDPAGTYSFTVMVTGALGASGTQDYTVTTVDPLTVSCTSTSGPVEVGVLYTNSCSASGGAPPYIWSIAGTAIPPLLSVSSTGGISYTPGSVMASYNYQVLATDSSSPALQIGQSFTGAIAPAVAITTTSPLPSADLNVLYTQNLTGSGGVLPFTWSATSLPTGLTLNASGVLAGKPTTAGTTSINVTLTDAAGGTSLSALSLTVNPALTITTTSPLPGAIVGAAYTDTFAATGGSGGYTWALASGTLPTGLTLSSAGVLSGTASSPGTASFSVGVTDSNGGTASGGPFSLTVSYPPLTITTSSPLANGTVNAAYNQTLTGTGGLAPYTWSLASGSLPAGLTLVSSPTTASVTGTPSTAGTVSFTVQLSDSATPPDTPGTKVFSITIGAGLTITTTSLPNATVGVAYNQTLGVAGGTGPYTWSISSGALPAPLTLNPTTGAITGIPAATSSATFTATVTDSTSTTANQSLTLNVVVAPSITTTSPLPNGSAGIAYAQTLAASGGTAPYKWTISSGTLPTGLTLTTAGAINGTPTAAGSFSFTVQLTDSTGVTATKPFSLTIISTVTITTPSPLPTGESNVSYTQTLAATGGVAPYTWSVTAGTLPAGLTLTPAGTVLGTTAANGAFSFTIQVIDSNRVTASAPFNLTIVAAVQITTAPALIGGALGAAYSENLTASAGVPPYTWSVSSGTMPAGLTLSSVGAISGIPTNTGKFTFTANATDALAGIASREFTIVIAAGLTITTPGLPVATVGVPYSQALAASGGVAPYTWTLTAGALPSGLSLSSGGSITGIPTTTGTAKFTVLVTDSQSRVSSSPFSITVAPALSITTATLPGGSSGVAYSQTLAAAGGTPPYTWSIVNGALPGGLTLSTAGAISGTPSAAGTFAFTAEVTDSAAATATQKLSIAVAGGLTITTGATLPGGSLNTTYAQTLSAAGGTPPYTWALTGGALPTGLTLSAAGVISGTPSATGTFTFTTTVTDSLSATASQPFTLIVAGLSITTTSLPNGTVNTAYSKTLAATGGTPPYRFTVSAGALPPGITLSGSTLSGTPSTAGSYTFTIQVTDFVSATATQPFTIVISGGGLVISTGATLPSAALGTSYSETVVASGTPPYAWTVTQGALPGGLTIDASTGTISGTPNAAGDFSFTLQVTDSTKATASQPFTLSVLSASFSGISGTATSGQQISGTLTPAVAYASAITGQITLAFEPDSSLASPATDPSIQFSAGGTTLHFTIPANSTAPVSFALQTGTVAGTITLTVSLGELSAVVTQTIQIAPGVPVISAASVSTNSSGFTVSVTAYSNTREVTQAVLQFTAASGQTLENSSVTVPLTTAASAWFQGSSSDPYGGQFILTLPFTVSNGSASAIASVSVVLTNSQGNSASANATF